MTATDIETTITLKMRQTHHKTKRPSLMQGSYSKEPVNSPAACYNNNGGDDANHALVSGGKVLSIGTP